MPRIIINSPHLDANESVYFSRQLEHVMGQIYLTQYPEFQARDLFPVSNEAGPGVDSIIWFEFDLVGMAKIISNYADGLPRVDVHGKENRSPVRTIGDAYGYSKKDIQRANRAGVSLDMYKGMAAKRAQEQLIDELAFKGDSKFGLVGLLSHPNIPKGAVPNGAGGTATFATKTSDEILKDLTAAGDEVVETTNGVERPDTLLMPLKQYNQIAQKRVSADNSQTILKFFLETNPYIKQVIPVVKLKGAGSGGTDIMVAYKRSADVVTLEIPVEFTQEPPQQKGLEWEVNCTSDIGGLVVRRPLAFNIKEGI